jgi:4-alpha-glucanotransferase
VCRPTILVKPANFGEILYNWEKLEKRWISVVGRSIFPDVQLFDAIRVDHFRGFESYWQVSAKEKNAIKGNWVKAPGSDLFKTIGKNSADSRLLLKISVLLLRK